MRRTVLSMILMSAVVLLCCSSVAASTGPQYHIDAITNTTVAPGGTLDYFVTVANVGDAPTPDNDLDGFADEPRALQVTLPAGVTLVSAQSLGLAAWDCSTLVPGTSSVTCTSPDISDPRDPGRRRTVVTITTQVDAGASGTLTASFDQTGGSGPPASTVVATRVSATPPGFGIQAFDGQVIANAAGDPYSQAAGHPYAVTTSVFFNTFTNPIPLKGPIWPVEPAKDIFVDLPPGFIGNPTATGGSKCTTAQLANADGVDAKPLCPPGSQVGSASFVTAFGSIVGNPLPVFNLDPPPNVPARFGFNVAGTIVTLDGAVRSGGDYGLSVNARNVPEGLALAGANLTFWGVPADPSHDIERACPGMSSPWTGGSVCTTEVPRRAFLRNPTSCSPPGVGLTTTLSVDSWFHPGDFKTASFVSHDPPAFPFPSSGWGAPQGTTGCELVPFEPTFTAAPSPSGAAGKPSAFTFDLMLPQSNDPDQIGTADLKRATVTLPAGVRVSPPSAAGLGACAPAQIGLHASTDAACPASSKVGTITIDTPLLDQPLQGSVYLATPHDNPFNTLLSLYLVARGPGVVVKLAGRVTPDPVTGQLSATFDDNPQLPFSRLHLEFKGGPRAALVNPPSCGTYRTHAVLSSWSGKTVASDSTFEVSRDGNGSPCGPATFSPGFNAGTVNPVSGAFSPFGLRLQRSDTDGEFRSLSSLSLPPGLLADVGSVSVRCTEAQADAHACPAESHIGTVNVGAGAGPDPIYVPGDVYLMGGFSSGAFRGDPFGLAVVVHATAGPFDLGYVVVKAGIQVHDDGSITTQTEPFPSILEGIPLQVKDIRVSLDRPRFILNPTNCNQMGIAGTVTSTQGATAPVSSRFQVGECARLAFKPKFTASTQARTSKATGASLHVHLATAQGPNSANPEANIAKVNVQLPVILPSRLTTLQKACTAAQFAKDPAGCPEGSFVGTAVAHTPILTSALAGPAILVSHGGVAFPDLVLVLQGEGVRLDLTGHTQIKKGITFSRFETVPDAPVSSFDLNFPQGPHSVLTATGSLCANTKTVRVKKRVIRRVHGHSRKMTIRVKKTLPAPLSMPTTITAQNGAVINQTTKIAVTGCAKATASGHARKATKAKTGNSRRSRR
jgi:hypothetical protein